MKKIVVVFQFTPHHNILIFIEGENIILMFLLINEEIPARLGMMPYFTRRTKKINNIKVEL